MNRNSFILGARCGTSHCLLRQHMVWGCHMLGLCLPGVCERKWRIWPTSELFTNSKRARKLEGQNKIYSLVIEQVVETRILNTGHLSPV